MASAMKTQNEMAQFQLQDGQDLMKVPKKQAAKQADMPKVKVVEGKEQVETVCDGMKPLVAPFAKKMQDGSLTNLPWATVNQVHITQDGDYCSLAVEFKKMILTVGIGPDATTLTVSDMRGGWILHALQRGNEIAYASKTA